MRDDLTCYNSYVVKMKSTAIVLHIPHSSKEIPPCIRRSFLLSDSELQIELIRLTDSYTDELFDCKLATKIIFPVSRLVIDPERFSDDANEPMSKFGMGVAYTKDSRGQSFRSDFTAKDRLGLIREYYDPHHQKLNNAVSQALSHYGRCLIIDCHSFPLVPFQYEEDAQPRPDICIGTDSFHTPEWLKDLSFRHFTEVGFSVRINNPFCGSMVPQNYYHANEMVYSIMIEINRSLYMDEMTGNRNSQFEHMQGTLQVVLLKLIERFLSLKT